MNLCFTPLFFLPRSALRWAYDQVYFEHLMDTPFVVLFTSVDKHGIWFPYKGDEVLWTWPWRRREREGDNRGKAPFISVGMSGNGEWGDARYWTLKELDKDWDEYFAACEKVNSRSKAEMEALETQDITERLAAAFPEPERTLASVRINVDDLTKAFKETDKAVQFFAGAAGMSTAEIVRIANETVDKLRAIPPDEMERLGKAFDDIDNRT